MAKYTRVDAARVALERDMLDREFAAEFERAKKDLDFAVALADAREMRNLTQADLSLTTGIRQPMISRYERGQEPELPTLRKLAAALNARIIIEADGRTVIALN